MMTNTKLLKSVLTDKHMSIQQLADEIGIVRQNLSDKMNNKRQFRQNEISKIADVLKLSPEQVDAIFFDINVD